MVDMMKLCGDRQQEALVGERLPRGLNSLKRVKENKRRTVNIRLQPI